MQTGTQLNNQENAFVYGCQRGTDNFEDIKLYFRARFDHNQELITTIVINEDRSYNQGPNLLDHDIGSIGIHINDEAQFLSALIEEIGEDYVFHTVEYELEDIWTIDTIYVYDHRLETLYAFETQGDPTQSRLSQYNYKQFQRPSTEVVKTALELRNFLNRFSDKELQHLSIEGNVNEFVQIGTVSVTIDVNDQCYCSIEGYRE